MGQKRVVALVLAFLIIGLIASINAADINTSDLDKAYGCLKDSITNNNCATKNIQLNAFNLLAGSYDSSLQSKCKASLLAKKNANNCWPSTEGGTCDLKSTAISIIALSRIGEDVEKAINWTLDHKRLETGLIWYLEIDVSNSSQCTVNGKNIILGEDKKINTPSGNPEGLEKVYNNYWFKITKMEKEYVISCNKSFTTSLLYQKPNANVYYVSSNPHSASAGDSTTEKVNSYCFGPTSGCDYDASLWVTMALAKEKRDISPYLPYLSSRSDEPENSRYLPSAFLLMLTEMGEYEEELKGLQREGKYWGDRTMQLGLTPLALSALSGRDLTEVRDSQKYILSLQDKLTGCWQEDKTSYILYLAWPKTPTSPDTTSPSTPILTCTDRTYSCVASTRCDTVNQEPYECSGFGDVCCRRPIQEQTCVEQGGSFCESGQSCSRSVVEAEKPDCCLGSCITDEQPKDPCPSTAGYSCKNACGTDENYMSSYTCAGSIKCCYKQATTESGSKLWLIILLVVLIILVFLAILFRNQLQVWWFRMKNGVSSKRGPGPSSRPLVVPPYRPVPPRPVMQRQFRPSPRSGEKDKEFEETMRKLKDMSK